MCYRCGSAKKVSNMLKQLESSKSLYQQESRRETSIFYPGISRESYIKMLSETTISHNGMLIHAHVEESLLLDDVQVGTTLVNMYGKCGQLKEARWVFEKMPIRDVVTWNVMMNVFSLYGLHVEALHLFCKMQRHCEEPTRASFICIIKACCGLASLERGYLVHTFITQSNVTQDVVVSNSLLNMYVKLKLLEDAHGMFNVMINRNVVSWTIMISGYMEIGDSNEAVQLFFQMEQSGINPDKVTFITVLDACTRQDLRLQAMVLHCFIASSVFFSDSLVGNAIVHMYAKLGNVEEAIHVFNYMPWQDVVTWTAVITAYSYSGEGYKAVESFRNMQQQGLSPNKITYICVIDACTSYGALKDAMQVHVNILESGTVDDVDIGTSLINMYGKSGKLLHSWDVFGKMPEQNIISWTAMITVCSCNGQVKEAVQLFNQTFQEGIIPNEVTYVTMVDICGNDFYFLLNKRLHSCIVNSNHGRGITVQNALISMYGKCGSLHHAEMVFNGMDERNVISWTSMMGVYAQHGQEFEALKFYELMQREKIHFDKATFLCVLDACTSGVAVRKVEEELHHFLDHGFDIDSVVGTALINLYGKCGRLHDAKRIFDKLPNRGLISWTVMIVVCAQHGQCLVAFELFYQMQKSGISPDGLTYICILYACSHAGLINEGQQLFLSFVKEENLSPCIDHYVCIVDLFGRAGCLDEAEMLLNNMSLQPTGELLMSFLGACRSKGDVERAAHYAKKMFRTDPTNAAPYVILSNIYSVWR